MSQIMNPYYDWKKLGWEMLSLEPNLSYAFDIICLWKVGSKVYTASDSGCSCPSPFEDYTGSAKEIEQKLEKVGSLEQAEQAITSWNKQWGSNTKVSKKEVDDILNELRVWLKKSRVELKESKVSKTTRVVMVDGSMLHSDLQCGIYLNITTDNFPAWVIEFLIYHGIDVTNEVKVELKPESRVWYFIQEVNAKMGT